MVYDKLARKPYVIIRNGYKYSITESEKRMKMEKIKALNASEIVIVRHLAKRSKMDCWLCVENDGTIRDLENNGKKLSIKKAITDMVEGLTPYDVEILSPKEVVTFVSLISKLN